MSDTPTDDGIPHTVRDNPGRERYELIVDGRIVSIAEYHLDDLRAVR